MQVKKRNIKIQEICPETYFSNNSLIIPISELKPKPTSQQNQYQEQEGLFQQQNIGQKRFEYLNNTQQNLHYPIQPYTQIQRKDVPTQVEQVFQTINPNVQQKQVNFKQEQEKYKDDAKIYYNDLNYKPNLIQQRNIEQNPYYNKQSQKKIEQKASIKTEYSQEQEKYLPYTNVVEYNQQQLNQGVSNLDSPKKKHIKIQQLNQELQQQRIGNEEKEFFLKYFITRYHLQNVLYNYGGLQIIKQSSEERKRDNKSLKEADQVYNQQKQQYEQMQFNKNQGQYYPLHQQGKQPKKPKIVEVQTNIELQNTILKNDEIEHLLYLQNQQFYQQQFQKNSQQQNKKQRIEIKEVQTQQQKNNKGIFRYNFERHLSRYEKKHLKGLT